MVNTDRMLSEFLELVRIDSVSGSEREIADLLIKKLKELNLEVFEDKTGSIINTGTGNIIARLPGEGSGKNRPAVMVCAHMDTVEPGRGVSPVVENGIVRSSGDTILGGDDKAGVAIILEAIRVIRECCLDHCEIEVVLTVFEEGGLKGAANIDTGLLKARIGYVLDSDDPPGTIITKAPTQDRITAVIKGRSAHAGICPEKGINAIEVAAKAIAGMRLGRIDSDTTANIGVISGGKATNIVPDSVLVEGETRSTVQSKKEAQTLHMLGEIDRAVKEYGASSEVKVENLYREFNLDESEEVVRIAVDAAGRLGLNPVLKATGGGSDANMFNEKGIPTVVLGIAMQNVHTTDEYISVEEMEKGCRYLVEIIKCAAGIE
ncbi:MAG: M20/M25/M40 family metallo-hydrolase [Bacillota bacterium]